MRFSSARRFILASSFAGAVIATLPAFGPRPPVNTGRDRLAVKGYDVVAYTTGAALRGTPEFEYPWNDARWRFTSAANRDLFAAAPETYAPQFGGYCAYAVSRGYTADIDPEAFKVVGGRLYLNYSKSVQRTWERDIPGNIVKAEANWPAVLNR
jgi:hypothetical protein